MVKRNKLQVAKSKRDVKKNVIIDWGDRAQPVDKWPTTPLKRYLAFFLKKKNAQQMPLPLQ